MYIPIFKYKVTENNNSIYTIVPKKCVNTNCILHKTCLNTKFLNTRLSLLPKHKYAIHKVCVIQTILCPHMHVCVHIICVKISFT